MAWLILLVFIGVPLSEIAVFIELGERLGLWATLVLIISTAVIGTLILRHQGLQTLNNARESLARNEMPVKEAVDGIFLLIAGALLLTPGFLTDGVGAALLCPPVRRILQAWFRKRLVVGGHWTAGETADSPVKENVGVIDVDFVDVTEEERRTSPWRRDPR